MNKRASLAIGGKISLEDVRDVSVFGRKVKLSSSALKRIKRSHDFLRKRVETDQVMYGINTGFGILSNVSIPREDLGQLQVNILRSHAAGVGEHLEDRFVRAMLLLRAQSLALGHSGVSLKLIQQIVNMLNHGICPMIPSQGSVGASGDLAPLAHLALVIIGEGRARVNGRVMSGARALSSKGLKPYRLGPKEGLALINGTQFMTAIGTLVLLESEHLADMADVAGAMTVEALRGTSTAFDSLIQKVRPHPGQVLVGRRMRKLLHTGGKSQIAKSHENCGRVQDPYSLRCIPQVHGASREMLRFVRSVLETEVNSVTDNPLVFERENKVLSGGNFHGQVVAMAMDSLSIAVAELANISEQRLEKLMNPVFSELPVFLSPDSGLNSGYMIVQVVAASIVSENKTLAHPASVDSIPTNADKEDHVSMGAWAARKAAKITDNSRKVIAMELMASCQGVDLLAPLKPSKILTAIHKRIRRKIPRLQDDRPFEDDTNAIAKMIENYSFTQDIRGI